MKTNAAAAARPTNRTSRTTNRDERVWNPIPGSSDGPTSLSGRPPSTSERERGWDIPLAGPSAGIKSEKEVMKYIRSRIRRGANGEAVATARARGGIRHLLFRPRHRLVAVRAGPSRALVSRGHPPLDLHHIHARRPHLPPGARPPPPEHPGVVLPAHSL